MDPVLEKLGKRAATTVDDKQARRALPADRTAHEPGRARSIPLFQPAQAIVSSKNLTNAVLGSVWPLDVRAVGTR